MNEPNLSETLYSDLLAATAALASHQLNALTESARLAVADSVNSGAARLELRVQLDGGATEILLVPVDGSAPLWIARTSPSTH
jgi:hypothetical protein